MDVTDSTSSSYKGIVNDNILFYNLPCLTSQSIVRLSFEVWFRVNGFHAKLSFLFVCHTAENMLLTDYLNFRCQYVRFTWENKTRIIFWNVKTVAKQVLMTNYFGWQKSIIEELTSVKEFHFRDSLDSLREIRLNPHMMRFNPCEARLRWTS